MSKTVSLLQRAHVASPCNASWDQMEGDEKRRFCFQCRKHVYDFSKMDSGEVEQLLMSESVCGQIWKRSDGHVITADCPWGKMKKRERALMWAARVLTFLVFVAATGLTRAGLRPAHQGEDFGAFAEANIDSRNGLSHLIRWGRLADITIVRGGILLPIDD